MHCCPAGQPIVGVGVAVQGNPLGSTHGVGVLVGGHPAIGQGVGVSVGVMQDGSVHGVAVSVAGKHDVSGWQVGVGGGVHC